jgi:CheY-like chemotaxis protein
LKVDFQRLGESHEFIIGDDPVAAFDLRDLRLVEVDAKRCQSAGHVLLRNFWQRGDAEPMDNGTGDIAWLFLFGHGALEGAPILILFGTGIILVGNKIACLRMNRSGQRPIQILCADDHTLVGTALAKVLSTAGFVVEQVHDGLAAWEKVSTDLGRFRVVIADHAIPKLSGLGLVQQLRNAEFPGRIIIYSNTLSPDDDLAYRNLRVDAIVENGPDSARLLAVVEAFHARGL